MRMRLPSRSAQIRPTSRYGSVAFVMVASVLGGIISLDEERREKEPSSANGLIQFHRLDSSASRWGEAERLPDRLSRVMIHNDDALPHSGVCLLRRCDAVLGCRGM